MNTLAHRVSLPSWLAILSLVLAIQIFPLHVLGVPPLPDLAYLDELEANGEYFWIDEDGASFLEHAVQHHQVDRAIRLVDKGALGKLDPRRPAGDVLREAFYRGSAPLIGRLVRDAKNRGLLNDDILYEGFAIAVSYGDSDVIALLLDENPGIAELGRRFPSLLPDAIYQNQAELAWFLVNGGFPVDAATSTGESALHAAIFTRDEPLARHLLDAQANLGMASTDGVTPLGFALSLALKEPAYFEFVDLLVAYGDNPCKAELKVVSVSDDTGLVTTLPQLLQASEGSIFAREFARFNCEFAR